MRLSAVAEPAKGDIAVTRPVFILRQCRSVGCLVQIALMILPQVHLRKPCYDFYFL
jgi:hypothetical protein